MGSCEEYQMYKYYKCNQSKRNSKVEVEKSQIIWQRAIYQ